ncbi:M48 family metalloprotease [Guyparkeria sp.]|uniref:beta-barrel assembly-enhancing protease n=1 Tax=Guyparkeria sp. TaxID=2035736 RepID=UPI003564A0C4
MLRATLLFLVLVLAATPARAIGDSLPDLGNPVDTVLSPAQERQIGAEVFSQLRERGGVVEDALIDSYLNDLGIRLVSSSPGSPFAPNLVVVDNPTINAFTVPGGHIAVFSGLMLTAENESELAGVIAHEIAHSTQRHIAQRVAAQTGNSMTAVAGFIAGILLGAVDPQLGAAVATAGIAGAAQSSINYTRMHEREADRIALDTLTRAGVDPQGMVSFFEKLQRRAGADPGRQFEFLRTHPMNAERISAIKDRLESLPPTTTHPDSHSFRLARARLAALVGNTGMPLAEESDRQYRRAIVARRAGNPREAARLLSPLYKQDTSNLWYALPLARALNDSGETERADRILKDLIELYPSDATLMRVRIKWMLDRGETDSAYQAARSAVEASPKDPTAALAMAEAANASGRALEHHEQLGRYFLLQGNLAAAHQELETAYTYTVDRPRARLRIESTLEDIERRAGQKREE